MAGFDYAKAAGTAKRLLDKFGRVGAIRRSVAVPGPDPFTPGTTVDTDYPVTLAVLPINTQAVGLDVEGTLIKATDVQILIAAQGLTITPTSTDLVVAGSDSFILIKALPLAPAGKVVLYDCVGTK
jgi:hypothetical protein